MEGVERLGQQARQLELDLFQDCKYPDGKPVKRSDFDDMPCGSASLYERYGCRGPECRLRHSIKIARQRKQKR